MTKKTPKNYFAEEINRVKKQGQEQYAHWNNKLFLKICEGAGQLCWNNIQHQQNKEQIFAGYMDLICEGRTTKPQEFCEKLSNPLNNLSYCYMLRENLMIPAILLAKIYFFNSVNPIIRLVNPDSDNIVYEGDCFKY